MVHWSPLALTAHGAIKSLGDYAGFAALLAVALLILLYFAQARELKRVSEWAAREAERPRLPAQAPAAAPAPVGGPPLPPPPATAVVAQRPPGGPVVAPTVQGVRRVQIPTAAAGAGAAATPQPPAAEAPTPDATTIGGSSATTPEESPTGETPGAVTPGQPPSGKPKPGDTALQPGATPPAGADAPADPVPAGAIALAATPVAERAVGEEFPPAEVAGPLLPPAPAPAPPAPRLPPAPHKDSPVIAAASVGGPRLPPAPGRRSALADDGAEDLPRRGRGKGGGSDASRKGRRRLAVFGVFIVLVAAAVVVVELTDSSSPSKKAHGSTATTSGHTTGKTPRGPTEPGHASITVAVLNGTSLPGEAGKVSATLTQHGYVAGRVADAPDQDTATTIVGYTPGHKAAAEEVVRSLALSGLVATPIDPTNEAAASAQGTPPQVVVVIGANYTE